MSLGGYGARRAGGGCAAWAALGGVGLLAGLLLAAFFSLPRLEGVFPPAGAPAASSRTPIRLTFNRPMDWDAVQAALTLSPAVPGEWSGQDRTLTFTPAENWPLGGQVSVSLEGGRSAVGLPLLGTQTWSFTVGTRRLVYLAGLEAPNLWVLPIEGEAAPQPITAEPAGVYDFAISPDGATIVYAARRDDGGADLRIIGTDGSGANELLACPGEACVSPAFAPDGRRLAYQRHVLVAGLTGGLSLGAARVHVLDLATGADDPVPEPASRFARWGPDGRLGYLDTDREAVVVRDLETGAITFVPNASGEMGDWAPDGQSLIFPELVLPPGATPDADGHLDEVQGALTTHLARVSLATNARVSLSAGDEVNDGSPVFAPDGAWLVFGRKVLVGSLWTPGRQMWLMRPDGGEARALTDDPLYNHSAFAWSPDGAWLAYMRYKTDEPGAPAEIWLLGLDAAGAPRPVEGGPRRLAAGYLPRWLP